MSARIVLLNGPPRCGKDTAARTFSLGGAFVHDKFSLPIKRAFAAVMGVPVHDNLNVYPYEDYKEQVIPALGVSYRKWQQDFAEKMMKPTCGHDVFARLLIERLAPLRVIRSVTTVLVSDCGFQIEADVLEQAGLDVRVIQLHRDGCSYSGDTREYVEGKRTVKIDNNGKIQELTEKIWAALS